jgi:uncharacterized protein
MEMPDGDAPKAAAPPPAPAPVALGATPVKVLLAGGFGVGKTTMVASVSEIPPIATEAALTTASRDDTELVPGKASTTVAMDFGRITIDRDVVLYLFGTPGQRRFWFMWDRLARGALAAVVLVDVRRLADCFGPLDYFERARLPFVVVVNQFDGAPTYPTAELRDALVLGDDVPILSCDARQRHGAKQVLISLVEHVADRHRPPRYAAPDARVPMTTPNP